MSKFFGMLKAGIKDFSDDECMVSGAALAYYTIFSLPPLLVLVFFVAGWLGVSDSTINRVVSEQIGMPVPDQSQTNGSESDAPEGGTSDASGEDSSLQSVAQRQRGEGGPLKGLGPVSHIIGAAILIFSATGVFAQLQHALNRAWEVEPDPKKGGWKNFLVKRGLSLGMIVVIGFLLLVSWVLTAIVDELVALVVGQAPGAVELAVGIIVNTAISLAVATLLFAAMYKILPDGNMRWKDLWVGAFITALLFVIGKSAMGWYLQNSQMGSAWGSAATSMIAMLVWVYYTSLIVLLGAELTQAWANRYGQGIVPAEGAVRVVEEKRHIRGDESSHPA